MRSFTVPKFGIILFLLVLIFGVESFSVAAQNSQDYATMKAQAVELFKQQKFTEALPVIEKLVKLDPNDSEVFYMFGFSLIGQATNTKDKDEERQLRIKARNAFIRSKQLGRNDPLVDAMIASIPPEGSVIAKGAFSGNKEAEALMVDAEAYFSQGKLDEALKNYQKALKLDPNIYEAALFSGDVYMHKENFEQAEVWYQKAITIDPNRETAYRYSATPLMKQKKYDQARDRYIEAFITEPYNRFSSVGISQWADVTGARLRHPKIDIPANVGKGSSGNTTITLGMGDSDDGSFAWTAYGLLRAAWQSGGDAGLSDKFKKAYPNEPIYRHSLAEEFEALNLAVSTLKVRMKEKDNPVKKLHPQLETLIKISDDGLLEPYILLALPDRGIAQDHPAYLKTNREKLKQYVLKYVISK